MRRSISAFCSAAVSAFVLAGLGGALAQEKATITDVFKQALAVSDAKEVSVRHYDVPPGWATPMHQHTGHMFLYVLEGQGAMETEGEVRAAGAGQVIHQLPSKPMIMRNASTSSRLRFVLFQVGPQGAQLTVPVK